MSIRNELEMYLRRYQDQYPTSLFRDKDFYCEWLAQTYYFVRHSTALLGYSMPHLKNDGLRHHFEHHLGEEQRHDLIALKDLEKMGRQISDYEESVMTQAFYQSQYYRISFEGGTSLLGYILFLEGLAVVWGKCVYEDIKDIHKGAALFLKVHAEEDPHHLESAIETILKLSTSEQEVILRNLRYSHQIYETIILSIIKKGVIKSAA